MRKFETKPQDAKRNAARKAAHHKLAELSRPWVRGLGDRGTVYRDGAPGWVTGDIDAYARRIADAVLAGEVPPEDAPAEAVEAAREALHGSPAE